MERFNELVAHLRNRSPKEERAKPSEVSRFLTRLNKESATSLASLEDGQDRFSFWNNTSSAAQILKPGDAKIVLQLRVDLRKFLNACNRARNETLPGFYRSLLREEMEPGIVYQLTRIFDHFKIPVKSYASDYYDGKGSAFCRCVVLMFKAAQVEITLNKARKLLQASKRFDY